MHNVACVCVSCAARSGFLSRQLKHEKCADDLDQSCKANVGQLLHRAQPFPLDDDFSGEQCLWPNMQSKGCACAAHPLTPDPRSDVCQHACLLPGSP